VSAHGCDSVTESHSDDVLFWLDPDNEWILQDVERILRAVDIPVISQPRTQVVTAAGPQPPAAVMAPNQSRRFRRIESTKVRRATQRAPPLSASISAALRAEAGI
jgi:hypothetical protein